MTTAADDSAVEDAFEALLAGRPAPVGAAGLAAFTGAVRASATTPGRPNAALAELLATGLLTDQSSPSVRTARSAGSAPERRPSRVRIRRRTAMIFPILLAKFLSAGAIAQAATGAGVVVVVVTGAGAAGVLPGPLQDTVATVVETATPLELPASDDDVSPVASPEDPAVVPAEIPVVEPVTEPVVEPVAETAVEPVAEPVVETPTDDGTTAKRYIDPVAFETWRASLAEGVPFGRWISDGAHQGFISYWVHLVKAERRAAQVTTPAVPAEGVEEVVKDEVDSGVDSESGVQAGKRGNGDGHGNGNRNGNGNHYDRGDRGDRKGDDSRDGDRGGDRDRGRGGDGRGDNNGDKGGRGNG